MWSLFDNFNNRDTIFARGLPETVDLQDTDTADVLTALCSLNSVMNTSFPDEKHLNALKTCHRSGWIHADVSQHELIYYVFPSPLHRWFIEYKLFGPRPSTP